MELRKFDLKDILSENTIVFENVPDLQGNVEGEDGSKRIWRIRPLTVERERQVEIARLENAEHLQKTIALATAKWRAVEAGQDPAAVVAEDEESEPGELNPRATAEQWAPIVAAMVCEPELDADYLVENFHGLVLRHIGETAEAFFQEGAGQVRTNREARRKATKK